MSEKISISGDDGTALTFFEPPILEEVTITIADEEYTVSSVRHPSHDPLVSAYAMIVKLHLRVEALEAELRGDKG